MLKCAMLGAFTVLLFYLFIFFGGGGGGGGIKANSINPAHAATDKGYLIKVYSVCHPDKHSINAKNLIPKFWRRIVRDK